MCIGVITKRRAVGHIYYGCHKLSAIPRMRLRPFSTFPTHSVVREEGVGVPRGCRMQKLSSRIRPRPKTEARTLKEKGLHEVMASGKALTNLLDTSVQADISHVSGEISQAETSDMLNDVRHYAQATAKRTMTASVALVLANFQRFLCSFGLCGHYIIARRCISSVASHQCPDVANTHP
jgi:hypothetical protein